MVILSDSVGIRGGASRPGTGRQAQRLGDQEDLTVVLDTQVELAAADPADLVAALVRVAPSAVGALGDGLIDRFGQAVAGAP